jgi:arylsulfatase A-like enzyme
METHSPFDPPSPYYPFPFWRRFRTRHLAGGPDQGLSYNAGVVEPGPDYARTLRAIYAGCGRYEDRVIGRLISAVEEGGRPTAVVIAADHGENLGEHGLYNHNSSLHEPLLHVPLAAWGNRLDLGAGSVEEPVSTARLGAWLLGLVDGDATSFPDGGPVVSEYEGTHLHNGIPDYIRMGIEENSPRVPALVFNAGLAVRRGTLKFMAAANGEESLFDLARDPGEERNILQELPDAAAEFAPDRAEWERRRGRLPTYETGDVAEGEIAEHLRELGYIE